MIVLRTWPILNYSPDDFLNCILRSPVVITYCPHSSVINWSNWNVSYLFLHPILKRILCLVDWSFEIVCKLF